MPLVEKKKRPKIRTEPVSYRPKWTDENYVRVYAWAKEGLGNEAMAEALGVRDATFRQWLATKPALAKALAEGREANFDFKGYCYRRLPQSLQLLWDQLEEIDYTAPVELVERILSGQDDRVRQRLWIHALATSNFRPDVAAVKVGVSYRVVDKWKEDDPDFAELVAELLRVKKDFIMGGLMDLVAARDCAATIYANKCLNADVGMNPTKTVKTLHEGHDVIDVNVLNLSVEELRMLQGKIEANRLPPKEVLAVEP